MQNCRVGTTFIVVQGGCIFRFFHASRVDSKVAVSVHF